jgi:hypothetical protein
MDADELVGGAGLSHQLEELALALARDDSTDAIATSALTSAAHGDRAAMALALAYALRRQARRIGDPGLAGRAAGYLTAALWS